MSSIGCVTLSEWVVYKTSSLCTNLVHEVASSLVWTYKYIVLSKKAKFPTNSWTVVYSKGTLESIWKIIVPYLAQVWYYQKSDKFLDMAFKNRTLRIFELKNRTFFWKRAFFLKKPKKQKNTKFLINNELLKKISFPPHVGS